jgi:D-alanyl-D-alanine carboxypeptidase/D-alanyl-D-alanine-endopeptidase (penicillin-binding protein 4)
MAHRLLAAAIGVLLAAACTSGTEATPTTTTTTTQARASTTTTTTAPAATAATTTSSTVPACRPVDDGPVSSDASPLTAVLEARLVEAQRTGNQLGVSVWVEGLGEVLAAEPDVPLLPASNQKLLTAMGVLDVLPATATLPTEAREADGDLVLVAGGDPTLTTRGPHSLQALAQQVRDAGVTEVPGRLLVDDTRFDRARTAPGWQDFHVPSYVGPLSALTVDDNRGRTDPAFLADPALAHGHAFRDLLAEAGVHVAGAVELGAAPPRSKPVAELRSPPISELVGHMLVASDNEVAEALTREAGRRLTGTGSTEAGTAALEARLLERCAPITPGRWADGSGLSRQDHRAARELRRLVQWAQRQPWWSTLADGLPLAGRTGTLATRFRGTAAEGTVRAKTGTIIGGSALTGVVTTASGRRAVFSVLVNGPAAAPASRALDELVVALAGS